MGHSPIQLRQRERLLGARIDTDGLKAKEAGQLRRQATLILEQQTELGQLSERPQRLPVRGRAQAHFGGACGTAWVEQKCGVGLGGSGCWLRACL